MSIFTGDTGGGGTAFGPLKWCLTSAPGATGTFFALPVGEGNPDAAEYDLLVAGPGDYVTLKVVFSIALATDSVTFTVRLNGVDTGIAATVTPGTTSAVATGTVSVVAGDRVSLKVVQSGTEATTTRIGAGLY